MDIKLAPPTPRGPHGMHEKQEQVELQGSLKLHTKLSFLQPML
jgi:hypothetical protein